MKIYYRWKYACLKKIQEYNADHSTDLVDISAYAAEETKLNDIVANIDVADAVLVANLTGITKDTKEVKRKMADSVIQFAHKGLPLARNANNNEMIILLKHEVSYILYSPKTVALSRARSIKDTLKENPTIFTNIDPADITDMETKISAYDGRQSDTKVAIEHKKINGTNILKEQFVNAEPVTTNMYDFVYGQFKVSKPELVTELADIMELDKTGAKHTGIVVQCIDGNPPVGAPTNLLQGVVLKVVELNITSISNIMGVCGFSIIKPGIYHVEISKAGFKTIIQITTFKRGILLEQEVTMERVA